MPPAPPYDTIGSDLHERETQLANVPGAASVRLYREAARDPGRAGRVEVPTATMMPLHDGVPAPREWVERTYDVQRWTVMEDGGHFPEWEVPGAVADDLRTFFAALPR